MNEKILEQLYKEFGRELFLYLYSMCKHKELAEDLLHETFFKALLALPDSHTNMRAWLYKVARNLFYNVRKHTENEVHDEIYLHTLSTDEVDKFLNTYISNEEHRLLYASLQKLSTPKREIIELQYFGHVSLKEISNILGISQENVRVISHRAKKELRKIMEVNGYDLS